MKQFWHRGFKLIKAPYNSFFIQFLSELDIVELFNLVISFFLKSLYLYLAKYFKILP